MSYKAKIIISVAAIVLLIPLAATVFLNQSDVQHAIESYVESKTGRAFTIAGGLGAEWSLSPTIYAQQIRLANSSWARTPFAFTADKLTLSLSFAELLRGKLTVTAIELDQPQLWIERNSETKIFNLDLRSPNKTSNKTAKMSRLFPAWVAIEALTIRNGRIFYFRKNRDWEFSIDHASVTSMGANRPTRIEASGEAEKTAISMSGELGSLESLLRFRESPVALSGYVGAPANQVSISGVIQNLFLWHGLNLWIDANVTNLADLSNLFGFWLPPYRNISARWELIQPETPRTMRVESLNLASSEHGLQAYAEGEIGQLIGFNEVDIRFNATGNLDREIISPSISHQAKLETVIAGSVFGDRRNLTLNIEHAEIVAEGISVHAAGAVANALNDWSAPLPLEMTIESPDSLVRLFDRPEGASAGLWWPDTQAIKVVANLNRRASSFDLMAIKISSDKIASTAESLNLNATGKINDLGSGQMGEIEFAAVINQEMLSQIHPSRLLALVDELSLVGAVLIKGSSVELSNLEIRGQGDGVQLSGLGSAGNLLKFRDFQMDMQLGVNSLSKLESLANRKLPKAGPLNMTGVLKQDAAGKFNLNKITATLVDPDLTIDIDGQILELGDAPNINLNIGLRLDSVAPIDDMYPNLPFSGWLSQLLPLNGSAQLSGQAVVGESGGYSLKKINVATLSDKFSGQISGRLDNLFVNNLSVTNLSAKAPVPSSDLLDRLAQTLSGRLSMALSGIADPEFIAAVDVPVLNPAMLSGDLSGSMDIVFADGGVGLENIDFNINSEHVMLNASGAFSQISPLQADEFELKFDAKSLAAIVRSTDLPLVWDNPAQGTISFKNSDNTQNISLDIEIAGNDLSGKMGFIHSKADAEAGDAAVVKRNYWAELVSKNFDLTELLVEGDDADKFFSETPLKLDGLMDTQAQINFSAEHFKSTSFILDDFQATISVDNGHLVTTVSGESSQGSINANLALAPKSQDRQNQDGQNKTGQKFNAHLDVNGEHVDFSALTKLGKSVADDAGVFSVAINLDGTGGSVSEIAGNATGSVLLEFSGAQIKNDSLQRLGGDLFLGLFDAINPLSQQDEYLDIECGVIQFNVDNGVAQTEHGLALKTTVVTLLGGGEIKLGDEKLKLVIRPKARRGFGINVNSIAKMIRVGGTMKHPRIEADPKGLVESGIALGAAIASGGLSLLAQGLYDKTRANADVCRMARNSGASSASGTDAAENDASKNDADVDNEAFK
ncbi:AsmA family protein [Candidatus Spongiihabitans sp.]|uniref:AsmA family protein n=1 Tax=Candidatus Spongiihabitans sp. TaxID=3101308 RepID=UPI003C7BB1F8